MTGAMRDVMKDVTVARWVAIVAGLVGFVLSVLTPLLPVVQTTATLNWPQGGQLSSVTAPLITQTPVTMSITVPCDVIRTMPPAGGVVLGTAPADAFTPNGYGLFNMADNTWEWCADAFRVRSLTRAAKARNQQAERSKERLLKGGSYLCHRSYCYRYRIAARTGAAADSSTGHVGFRLVFDD